VTIAVTSGAVEQLADLLSRETGQMLSEGRRWRIDTMLRPLLRDRRFTSLDELLCAIEREPDGPLKAATIDAILNHESSFFRDVAVFKTLEDVVLPKLAAQASERLIRIWCVGCSTGQEAYSLAMMIKRSPDLEGLRVSIHATDVSALAIEKARRGIFAQMDVQRGLPVNELLRWFEPVGPEWSISDELREMVTFRTDNILHPRSASGLFDLILCRNVLLYFPENHRRDACAQIARRARPQACLVLGAGEMLAAEAGFVASRDSSCIYTMRERREQVAPTNLDASSCSASAQPCIEVDEA
jgi:chemotaxis protein methyltransferase CheR